jgi:hypothetical protein
MISFDAGVVGGDRLGIDDTLLDDLRAPGAGVFAVGPRLEPGRKLVLPLGLLFL